MTIREKTDFIVGTVKGLSDKYGIRYLLEAVSIVKSESKIPIKLRIAGKGPQEQEYKELAKRLGIDDITTWLGFISQEQAAVEWANMDVAVIPSTLDSESFGVSAVEAQACGTPLIISDIPGLKEATNPGETSIVAKRQNAHSIAESIIMLYKNQCKRDMLRKNSIANVKKYEIDNCFSYIENLFGNYRQRYK